MQTDRALALAVAALAARPAGLVTDLDGTLAPIVSVPSEARLVQGTAAVLRDLASRLAVVAVITGRAAADARRILGDAGDLVLVIGNHGLEWLDPGSATPGVDDQLEPLRLVLAGLLARIPAMEGVTVEDKGLSATIHYRQAPDPEAARISLRAALGDQGGTGLELREGRRSIEVRPVGRGDKGTAVQAVVERFGLRGLVVAGDDTTDLDMFASASEERTHGLTAALFGVAGGREVPGTVAEVVDMLLPDPETFVHLLRRVAEVSR